MTTFDRDAAFEQFATAHGFTLEELAANRAGKVHPAQLEKAQTSGMGTVVFFVVLALAVLGGGLTGAYLLYDDYSQPISRSDMNGIYAVAGGSVVVALGIFVGALGTLRTLKRRRAAFATGSPQVVEGTLEKISVRRRQAGTSHHYRIAGRAFQVDEAAWELAQHGGKYRAYVLERELLSLEPAKAA